MATTSISQMTTAATVDNGDLFEIAHPDAGSATGYASNKQSLAAIADHMATAVNHPTLNTTAKNIVGAINELEAGGGGGGSSTLAGLTDVAISTPTNGQALVYDATAAKWKNGAGGGAGGIDYSETEQDTGLKWIDGKTVYQKTAVLTNVAYSTVNTNYTVMQIPNIETPIDMTAIFSNSGKTIYHSSPYVATDAAMKKSYFDFDMINKLIFFTSQDTWGSTNMIVTARYTKTQA